MSTIRNDVVNYVRELAEKHKDVLHSPAEQHFFRWLFQEVTHQQIESAHDPMVLLEPMDGRFTDNLGDDRRKRRTIAFVIAKRVTEYADWDEIDNTISECEAIGEQFIAKMINDRDTCVFLKWMDPNSVKIMDVGPLLNYTYGSRFEIEITTKANLHYDATKWNP